MKTLGYYSEKLKYGSDECVGFVVYVIDDATNREISNYSHIKCGNDSYVSSDNEITVALKSSEGEIVSDGIEKLFDVCGEGNMNSDGEVNPETHDFKLTVNYLDYNTGTSLDSREYEYDGNPVTINTELDGYDFAGYNSSIQNLDLNSPVAFDSDNYIDLYFKERIVGDVKYVVNHWKQKVNGGDQHNADNFVLAESYELHEKPNISFKAPLKSFEGFNDLDETNIQIKSDGTSVFDFYYTRKSYEIKINTNEFGTVDKQTVHVKYETEFNVENNKLVFGDGTVVTATPKTVDGVEGIFRDWTPSSGKVLEDTEIYAHFNVPNQYNVGYNCNGGTGTMNASTFMGNRDEILPNNACVFPGYTFDSWNTRADGRGTKYENGAKVKDLCTTENCSVTLYAQWKANTYYIELYPNGGSGSMQKIDMKYGQTVNLPVKPFTNGSLSFFGWTGPNNQIFEDGQSVNNLTTEANGIVKLYARWGNSGYIEDFEDSTPNPYFTFKNFDRMDIPNNPGFYPEDYEMGLGFYSPKEYKENKYNSAAATFSFSFDAERSGTISVTYGRANPNNNAVGNYFGGNSGGASSNGTYAGGGNSGGGYDAGWGIVGLLDNNNTNRLLYVSQCIEQIESMCSMFGGNGQASDPKYGTKTVSFTAGHHDVEFTFLNWWGGGAFIDNIEVIYN